MKIKVLKIYQCLYGETDMCMNEWCANNSRYRVMFEISNEKETILVSNGEKDIPIELGAYEYIFKTDVCLDCSNQWRKHKNEQES